MVIAFRLPNIRKLINSEQKTGETVKGFKEYKTLKRWKSVAAMRVYRSSKRSAMMQNSKSNAFHILEMEYTSLTPAMGYYKLGTEILKKLNNDKQQYPSNGRQHLQLEVRVTIFPGIYIIIPASYHFWREKIKCLRIKENLVASTPLTTT